ncbi:MAG: hypothetical protein ACERKV_03940 [Clostridiaceae bacterium]
MDKKQDTNKNIVLVIFVEGQTDKEFYKKMIAYIKSQNPDKDLKECKIKNLNSVTHYNKAPSIFENEIAPKYKGAEFKIICSYDYDAFQNLCSIKPPVNWPKLKKQLNSNNKIINVYEIKAYDSIEDWFLKDMTGLCKYLGSTKIYKLKDLQGTTGEKKMKDLFKRNSKIYQKGYNTRNFIDYLDFEVLYNSLEKELEPLKKCMFI